MKSTDSRPLIRASEIARRWGKPYCTVAALIAGGSLKPVTRGCSPLFALADVEQIESGHQVSGDVTITSLTYEARTSPTQLLNRLMLAYDCLVLMKAGGWSLTPDAASNTARAVAALLAQINGGDGEHGLPAPAYGPRESHGLRLDDPGAHEGLLKIIYAALLHPLMSTESRDCLNDLGPRDRSRFAASLNHLKNEIDSFTLKQ